MSGEMVRGVIPGVDVSIDREAGVVRSARPDLEARGRALRVSRWASALCLAAALVVVTTLR